MSPGARYFKVRAPRLRGGRLGGRLRRFRGTGGLGQRLEERTFVHLCPAADAAALGVAILCLIVASTVVGLVFGAIAIAMNRKLRERKVSGLLLALSPLVFSLPALGLAISIYSARTFPGLPNFVLIPISALPLISAIYAWMLWRRAPKDQPGDPR